ncbi:MAG: hypothetical protein A3C27_03765 [Candidatus Levybacteria bacterium RIFCSPHIGHO2_02_FULL_39_36]|nr:MAG: hypothetical protein A3C27_03765 [Candidatus Levybacteria bacterium RIFCSPHIGHO2_02_FULL_39_36]OGH45614.1 MAG: hypothetical protein A3H82_00035 [Candidatus Levybacteria bacterium RIFCSPLOWO2_02_FULL_39_26]OGH47788.1 MAG: hypothetical protein A3G66_01890 [Candidatus Levybacteria bacterium RIFCSPLOWO2_12_FULL_39_17]
MNLELSEKARKCLKKLPRPIQKKAYKSFQLLLNNPRHPSLRSRKMSGTGFYEARIDYHNRFAFSIEGDTVLVLTLGMHDEGLGKK